MVNSFRLVQIINGTAVSDVNQAVDSTTPDNSFRWDSTAQQWIFNINSKGLKPVPGMTFFKGRPDLDRPKTTHGCKSR